MKKVCLNCENSDYTENQIGWSEWKNRPLSNHQEVYCKSPFGRKKQQRGYVNKGFTCAKFQERVTPLTTETVQKRKEREELERKRKASIWH